MLKPSIHMNARMQDTAQLEEAVAGRQKVLEAASKKLSEASTQQAVRDLTLTLTLG